VNRAGAVTYISTRFGKYLSAAGRAPADGSGLLKEVIDDALLALGYDEATLATAAPEAGTPAEDFRVQLAYRAMVQINRDLGGTVFDVSTAGDSFKLSQLKAQAKDDLEETRNAVMERFLTLGTVPSDSTDPFRVIDLNYLDNPWCEVLA
jgi:hypothetical protein